MAKPSSHTPGFCYAFALQNGTVWLESLSKNGKLYVNDKLVMPNSKQILHPGDEITIIASTRVQYVCGIAFVLLSLPCLHFPFRHLHASESFQLVLLLQACLAQPTHIGFPFSRLNAQPQIFEMTEPTAQGTNASGTGTAQKSTATATAAANATATATAAKPPNAAAVIAAQLATRRQALTKMTARRHVALPTADASGAAKAAGAGASPAPADKDPASAAGACVRAGCCACMQHASDTGTWSICVLSPGIEQSGKLQEGLAERFH